MSEVDALLSQLNELSSRLVSYKDSGIDGFQRNLATNNFATTTIDSGNTAWMLASCALVLFMTMPGLAIYYGGMVASKNVLAVAMQIFSITCLITFLWLAVGYSLAFTPTNTYVQTEDFDEQKKSMPFTAMVSVFGYKECESILLLHRQLQFLNLFTVCIN